jgi:hypothetical protein
VKTACINSPVNQGATEHFLSLLRSFTAGKIPFFLFAVPRLKMSTLICFALKEEAAPF